jgi:PTS system cellobiose-specific IIB component
MLCCGGGFSSSVLTALIRKQITEKNLMQEISIDFFSFDQAAKIQDGFEVIFLCPHLFYQLADQVDKFSQPLYILPPKMYGNPQIQDWMSDAKLVLEIFEKNKQNPVTFPGEENILRVTRGKAYQNA